MCGCRLLSRRMFAAVSSAYRAVRAGRCGGGGGREVVVWVGREGGGGEAGWHAGCQAEEACSSICGGGVATGCCPNCQCIARNEGNGEAVEEALWRDMAIGIW